MKVIKYIKKYPFDAAIWGLIGLGLLLALYFTYTIFLSSDTSVKYGNRLEGIETVPVNKKQLENKLDNDSKLDKVVVNVKGRIINILLYTKTPANSKTMSELAGTAINTVDKDVKNFYDIQIFITETDFKEDESKVVIAYLKAGSSELGWTYNKGAE